MKMERRKKKGMRNVVAEVKVKVFCYKPGVALGVPGC
jgi:hypothetical protein